MFLILCHLHCFITINITYHVLIMKVSGAKASTYLGCRSIICQMVKDTTVWVYVGGSPSRNLTKGGWSQQNESGHFAVGFHTPNIHVGDIGTASWGPLRAIKQRQVVTASCLAVGFYTPNNVLVTANILDYSFVAFLELDCHSNIILLLGFTPPTKCWWH